MRNVRIIVKGSERTEPKNRDVIVYKGVVWKYASYYGEWHPSQSSLGVGPDRLALPTIYSTGSGHLLSGRWKAGELGGDSSATPLEALERWRLAYIKRFEDAAAVVVKQLDAINTRISWFDRERWVTKTKPRAGNKKKRQRKKNSR